MKTKITLIIISITFLNTNILFALDKSTPLSQSNLLEVAQNEYAKANYDKSLQLFQNIINAGNAPGEAYFFSGLILESKRDFSKSIHFFLEAIQLSLKKEYYTAALWKIILYFQKIGDYTSVLTYANILKNKIPENEKLTEILKDAEIKASPAKKEAKNLVSEATKLETQILSEKGNPNFIKNNTANLNKIASAYERATVLDDTYTPLLWKAANYYEKLNENKKALEIYKHLSIKSDNTSKAKYKCGIMYKKLKEYEIAKSIFIDVLALNNISDIIYYYTYINLGQIYLSTHEYENARIFFEKSMDPKFIEYRKAKNTTLLMLNLCLTTYPFQVINTVELSPTTGELIDKNSAKCNLNNIDVKALKDNEQSMYYMVLAKQNHFRSLYHVTPTIALEDKKNPKKKRVSENESGQAHEDNPTVLLQKAINYYIASLLPDHATVTSDEQSNNSANQENGEDTNNKESVIILYEIPYITEFFFSREKYKIVHLLVEKYPSILKDHPNFTQWQYTSSFYEHDYSTVINVLSNLNNRNLEQEEWLLLSYAHLKQWNTLFINIKAYIKNQPLQYTTLNNFLNTGTIFQEMKIQAEYPLFQQELESIVNPPTTTPSK